MDFDPTRDYPLGERRPDLLTTPSGIPFADLTLAAVEAGLVDADDLRATPETLARQAAVALGVGRYQLADNLLRASELATVPDALILDLYTALRPHRSTAAELEAWATTLEGDHGATSVAAFVREAASVYASRDLLAIAPGDRAVATT